MRIMNLSSGLAILAVVIAVTTLGGPHAYAQAGWVLSHQKVSDTEGNFTGTLDDSDRFGRGLARLGDLNGDGVGDLAVGHPTVTTTGPRQSGCDGVRLRLPDQWSTRAPVTRTAPRQPIRPGSR
jgi:hypothetical protein